MYPVKVIVYTCLQNGAASLEPSTELSPVFSPRAFLIDNLGQLIRSKNLGLPYYNRMWVKSSNKFVDASVLSAEDMKSPSSEDPSSDFTLLAPNEGKSIVLIPIFCTLNK